ncbi:MAG TPA: hypothetical protein VFV67_15910 [Actinophytocola sp.]|uniref:hypothetical protein n=1 Tax=Actinophytocola sp. TaxID=1872138 RepID=UPI002DB88E68|nr:hypothetical protein [Actinophytocola sp.]HEU5472138.1 hypothetical protein [Actinophytocola sp.]
MENETPDIGTLRGQLAAEAVNTPPAPPPMPTASKPMADRSTAAAVEPEPSGGWSIDPYSMRAFVRSIDQVREWLRVVGERVEGMQSDEYTPKLGTSPVATQLERKFADRLDAALDNPQRPTTGGLRPMLSEAMRRMEAFVATAEAALRDYREQDQEAANRIDRAGQAG